MLSCANRWIILYVFVTLSFVANGAFAKSEAITSDLNIHLRGQFQNACIKFEKEKTGHVAFIGGSITEMDGYRPMVMDILKRRFSETKFTFTDAGISSTCSTLSKNGLAIYRCHCPSIQGAVGFRSFDHL